MEWKLNDQVILRRPILHGRGSNLIKTGTILALAADGKHATVSFPADQTRVSVLLDQLEPVTSLYGRARVQVDPTRRSIGNLMR
jgi:hypothetical protein